MSDVSSDAFATVADLIALAIDAPACRKRLKALKTATEKLAKEQAKFDTARQAHEQKVAADTAKIDAREQKLRDREVAAHAKESDLERREKIVADARPDRFDRSKFPGTLVQEPEWARP